MDFNPGEPMTSTRTIILIAAALLFVPAAAGQVVYAHWGGSSGTCSTQTNICNHSAVGNHGTLLAPSMGSGQMFINGPLVSVCAFNLVNSHCNTSFNFVTPFTWNSCGVIGFLTTTSTLGTASSSKCFMS